MLGLVDLSAMVVVSQLDPVTIRWIQMFQETNSGTIRTPGPTVGYPKT